MATTTYTQALVTAGFSPSQIRALLLDQTEEDTDASAREIFYLANETGTPLVVGTSAAVIPTLTGVVPNLDVPVWVEASCSVDVTTPPTSGTSGVTGLYILDDVNNILAAAFLSFDDLSASNAFGKLDCRARIPANSGVKTLNVQMNRFGDSAFRVSALNGTGTSVHNRSYFTAYRR